MLALVAVASANPSVTIPCQGLRQSAMADSGRELNRWIVTAATYHHVGVSAERLVVEVNLDGPADSLQEVSERHTFR